LRGLASYHVLSQVAWSDPELTSEIMNPLKTFW